MSNELTVKMSSYEFKGKKGVDDLLNIWAWLGNSQGDTSATNDIEVAKDSKGWMSFQFVGIDPTNQEAINKEVEKRKQVNEAYVEQLKKDGEYEKEITYTIHMKDSPIFDHPHFIKSPLESHRLIFIDPEK